MTLSATTIDDSTATLQRLRTLESLYEQGYHNDVVDRTIYKLLEHQVQQDEAQLAELADNLHDMEERYGISSADFFQQYQAGQTGDDADFFEWQVLYKMYQRLSQAVDLLKSQLSPVP